jgi:catechol 2,3-dioxygenase-like lactoylglutathione lyase family enzyme
VPQKKKPARRTASGVALNHAMIYVREMAPALNFYTDLLGFRAVDTFEWQGRTVYARLRAPRGDSTIALHMAEPGQDLTSEGVRLYFEVKDLEKFCAKLEAAGVVITKPPKMMPWGWKHAYLNDPAGHEVSLYWSAGGRFRKTRMAAPKAAAEK